MLSRKLPSLKSGALFDTFRFAELRDWAALRQAPSHMLMLLVSVASCLGDETRPRVGKEVWGGKG